MGNFKRHLNHGLEILFRIFPLNFKQIMFLSFRGQYNDNPKYISEAIHKLKPDIKIIWAISDRCHEREYIPDYVQTVSIDTVKYAYLKSKSAVLVDNGAGWFLWKNAGKLARMVIKPRQYNLSTWHGTPLKKIGLNAPGNENVQYMTTSNCLLAGSKYAANVFLKAFDNLMPIELTGTPRNDLLINYTQDDVIWLRKKLKLPLDKKLLLYAPTYRDNPLDSGVRQLEMMDVNRLKNALHNRFGGEWELVFRVHNMVLETIEKSKMSAEISYIDGNKFDDMVEYAVACDALLSDYSGAVYDNAICSKPCFLFAHDLDHYKNDERGMYMDINDFPYDFCSTFDQLLYLIEKYDFDQIEERRKEFLKRIGNVEDGKASERVAKIILEHMKTH